ncbi:hypothetical protein Tco_0157249 [Tanacetum coccineum]
MLVGFRMLAQAMAEHSMSSTFSSSHSLLADPYVLEYAPRLRSAASKLQLLTLEKDAPMDIRLQSVTLALHVCV